jgi:hypothetical protein
MPIVIFVDWKYRPTTVLFAWSDHAIRGKEMPCYPRTDAVEALVEAASPQESRQPSSANFEDWKKTENYLVAAQPRLGVAGNLKSVSI